VNAAARRACHATAAAVRLAAVAALALTPAACSVERTYTAEPIAARVVDADTGAPVEGVNVVAAWQAKGGLEGGNVMGYVMVMEDVTDADGAFSFPGWGPKKWRNGAIRDGAPLLIVFKPGYGVRLLWEEKYGVEFATPHMSSSWDKQVIALKRFEGSAEDYAWNLSGLRTFLDGLLLEGGCAWRGVPNFLRTVDRQHREFVRQRTRVALDSLQSMQDNVDKSCGSLPDFVEEHAR